MRTKLVPKWNAGGPMSAILRPSLLALMVFTFMVSTVAGQQSSTPMHSYPNYGQNDQQKSSEPNVKAPSTTGAEVPDGTKQELPYLNYQGISDPVLAKKAWAQDHPELYANRSSVAPLETHYLNMPAEAMQASLKNAEAGQIRGFIQEVLNHPLPAGYSLPEEFKSVTSPDAANALIASRYPEFAHKQGTDFLYAIAQSPFRYSDMILECKATRTLFVNGHSH